MDVESQPLPSQQFVQFSEMSPGTSSGAAAASASALACNLSTILSFSCRSQADQLARSLQLKLKNIGTTSKEMTDTNNNASPTRSPTNSLTRMNGVLPVPVSSPSVSKNYLRVEDDTNDDEDSDEYLDEKARMKRSSSLKTGKTPPGTPCRKKIVRFADALGLDLAEVRSFLDEIPNVPKSAYKDLDCEIEKLAPKPFNNFVSQKIGTPSTSKTLVSTFHQPVSRPDFFDRVRDQKVSLENAFLSDNFTIKGTVRVLNMDFHKSVYIRYSTDEWKTFTEVQASYVNGSCDGFSDKFQFAVTLCPDKLEIGNKISFAARFHCQGQQFWDSNSGQNYGFHVTSASTSSISQNQQNFFNYQHSPYSPIDDQWLTTHMWM